MVVVREADGTERVLVDPAALSEDESVVLDGFEPSPDGARLGTCSPRAATKSRRYGSSTCALARSSTDRSTAPVRGAGVAARR